MTGGDQGRLRGVLPGTGLDRALRRLLNRGGAVGGSSAGASLLGATAKSVWEPPELGVQAALFSVESSLTQHALLHFLVLFQAFTRCHAGE